MSSAADARGCLSARSCCGLEVACFRTQVQGKKHSCCSPRMAATQGTGHQQARHGQGSHAEETMETEFQLRSHGSKVRSDSSQAKNAGQHRLPHRPRKGWDSCSCFNSPRS